MGEGGAFALNGHFDCLTLHSQNNERSESYKTAGWKFIALLCSFFFITTFRVFKNNYRNPLLLRHDPAPYLHRIG